MPKTAIEHPDRNASAGAVAPGTIEKETRLTLSHIGKILEAAGGTFDDVVKCSCHLAGIRDFDAFNRVYAEFFAGVRPARVTVHSTPYLA